ncbi:hypothetical protein [Bradyrhizobium sp. AZCC 2289]|uniref:hypothetical protein n=1 Tax=Bradyrhizobium sp. AZCC 2289 TaxID=3117026 RepID=UPI002FF2ACF3
MRIMAVSACKPDASETRVLNQQHRQKPPNFAGFNLGNRATKLHAIQALNC